MKKVEAGCSQKTPFYYPLFSFFSPFLRNTNMNPEEKMTSDSNVIYLKTLPVSLRSINHEPLDKVTRDRISLELSCFCVSLLFNGRPGKERLVMLVRGHTMDELMATGASIKLSPWHETKDNPFQDLRVFEVHGPEISGWWAEIDAGVMAFLSFSGLYGLEAHDLACLLAESQFPTPPLIEWSAATLAGGSVFIENVAAVLPAEVFQELGNNFKSGNRILRLASKGQTSQKALFSVYEYDRDIEPHFD